MKSHELTHIIVDNALPDDLCVKTSMYAEQSDQWIDAGGHLVPEEKNALHSTFPIMPIAKNGEMKSFNPFSGWFLAMGSYLVHTIMGYYGFSDQDFDPNLQRVHLVAHRPGEKGLVVPHRDLDEEHLSLIWHLSQFKWNDEWGGSTFIEDQEIKFEANRAILFHSHLMHYGVPPNPNCPYVRIVLNTIFKVKPKVKDKIFNIKNSKVNND